MCMVYNADQYLSEFLAYHLTLVDHIFLIDHKSHRDLRGLDLPGLTVVRSNHVAQFQSECTNLVLDHFNIRQEFDWLFVLDVDEFLPFKDKGNFLRFLKSHSSKKILRLRWRNGIPFNNQIENLPTSLIDCASVRFFYKPSVHYKSFVNMAKIGTNFIVPTGAHDIAYAFKPWYLRLPYLRNRTIYQSFPVEKSLFHIVAFNKDDFLQKIQNYIKQMEYREHIKGQGGWLVREYPSNMSDDQWLWYVANFRVSNSNSHQAAKEENFLPIPIFAHLELAEVDLIRKQLDGLTSMKLVEQSREEKMYLEHKEYDTKILENLMWFDIDNDDEIICVLPKRDN